MSYISLDECVASGNHLSDCDEDGYCNGCGYQDHPEDREAEAEPVSNQAAIAQLAKLIAASELLDDDEGFIHDDDGRIHLWACQCGMTLCPRPNMKYICCDGA